MPADDPNAPIEASKYIPANAEELGRKGAEELCRQDPDVPVEEVNPTIYETREEAQAGARDAKQRTRDERAAAEEAKKTPIQRSKEISPKAKELAARAEAPKESGASDQYAVDVAGEVRDGEPANPSRAYRQELGDREVYRTRGGANLAPGTAAEHSDAISRQAELNEAQKQINGPATPRAR